MPGIQEVSVKKRSKREENREKSKEIILRASLELFSMKGYGSTTMELIADRAGISRGLPYLYFESKERLLYAILQRHFAREKEYISGLPTEYKNSQEFVEIMLRKMCYPFEEGVDGDRCLEMRLIMSMMLLPETKSIIQDWVMTFQSEIMENYFQNFKKNFESFGIKDVETEMKYLRMLFLGYAFSRLCLGEDFPAENIRDRVFSDYLAQINLCSSKKKDIDSKSKK